MWQEIIVAMCVFSALAYVIYSYLPDRFRYKLNKTDHGCKDCNACSSKKGCH